MLKRLFRIATFCGATFAFLGFLYYAFFARPDLDVLLERARETVQLPSPSADELQRALRDLDVVVEFSRAGRPESLKEGLRWRARAHRRTRSYQASEQDLAELAAIDPNDRGATFDLVDTLLAAGRQLEDVTYLERAVAKLVAWRETHTHDVQAQQVLGRTLIALGERLVARNDAVVDSLIEGASTLPLVRRLREVTLRRVDDAELPSLVEALRQELVFVVAEKREEIVGRAERARRALDDGIAHLHASFWMRPHLRFAAELLEALDLVGREEEVLVLAPVLLHPEYPEALRLPRGHFLVQRTVWAFASALRDRGFLRRARDVLEAYRVDHPDVHGSPDMALLLDLHLAIGELEPFERLVGELSEDPVSTSTGWWWLRGAFYTGAVHHLAGRAREAVTALESFVRLQRDRQREELPRLQRAQRMLAGSYLALGRGDDANRAFTALINLADDPGETQLELSVLTLEEFGLPREAGRLLGEAIRRKPALTPRALPIAERIAQAMLREIGITIEDAVRQAAPGAGGLRFDPAVELQVARRLVESGRARDAVRMLDQLLGRHPEFHPAQRLRGRALSALGQRDRAVSNYRAYLEIVPQDDEAWLELAELAGEDVRIRGVKFQEVRFRALRHSLDGPGALQLGVDLVAADQLERALRLVSPERLQGEDAARARLVLAEAARDLAPQIALGLLAAIPPESRHRSTAAFQRVRIAARIETPESLERLALEIDPAVSVDPRTLADTIAVLVCFRHPRAAYELLRRAEPKDLGSTYFRLLGLTQIALGKPELGEASLDRALAFRDADALSAGLDLLVRLSSEGRLGEMATVAPLLAFIVRDERSPALRRSLALGLALAGQARQAATVYDALERPTDVEAATDHDWTRDVLRSLIPPDDPPPPEGTPKGGPPRPPREPDAPWLLEFEIPERRELLEVLALDHAGHRTVEVQERIAGLLHRHPSSLPLRWWFVKAQLANGRFLEAAEAEQVLLLENPEFEPALRMLENTLQRVGRKRQALAIRGLRLWNAAQAPEPDVDHVAELALSLFEAGESLAVTQTLLALPDRVRDAMPIRILSARLLNEAGDHRQALRLLRPLWTNALANPQTRESTLLAIGRQVLTALLGTESIGFPETTQVVGRLLPVDPQDPFLIALDAATRMLALPPESGERTLARTAGIEALWKSPRTLHSVDQVATRALVASLERSVPQFLERVLWIEMCKVPANLDVWLLRAQFLERSGREREALEEYDKLHGLRVSPEATVGLIRLRIRYADDPREMEGLLPLLERELTRRGNPTDAAPLHALRIDLLRSLGRLDEALDAVAERARELRDSPALREAALRAWFEAAVPGAFARARPLVDPALPALRSTHLGELLRSAR